MTTTTCWADPLTRRERRTVAELLARASKRFWAAGEPNSLTGRCLYDEALVMSSAEMRDLHLDVTERAEVPVSGQAAKRFAELQEMAEGPDWLGI